MIYVVATYSIQDSVGNEIRPKATEWAKKITRYIKSKWPEIDVVLFTNYDGAQSEIHWSSKHESMAAWEKWAEEYNQDDGRKSLFDEVIEISKGLGGALLFGNNRAHFYKVVDLD